MAKTFRQEVATILCGCNCSNCLHNAKVDRICEAVKRMGERMPGVIDAEVDYLAGYVDCRDACQAHIAKETEG